MHGRGHVPADRRLQLSADPARARLLLVPVAAGDPAPSGIEPVTGPGREQSMDPDQNGRARVRLLILRVAGAGLLAATGAIHLDLYLTGYRHIPTIGWLFLLQVIAAFVLAAAALLLDSAIVALAGAGFVFSTLGGY